MNQLEQSLFPVSQFDAAYFKDGKEHESTGYKMIVRDDTNEVLSCVTDKYKLVTNKQVLDKVIPTIDENGGQLSETRIFGKGARSLWKFTFPDTKVEIAKNDFVNPSLIINNSYDTSKEASVLSGAFRLVCENGMVIGWTLSRRRNRHIIWNDELEDMDEIVIDAIAGIKQVFDNEFPKLINTELKKSDISKLIKMFPTRTVEDMNRYMIDNPPKNYWDLLNIATWTSTHAMKRKYESTHKLETTIYPKIKKMAQA